MAGVKMHDIQQIDDHTHYDPPFPAQKRWFVLLFALIVLSRAALLLLSQHYLMADEAQVGLLALDISEGKPVPIFLSGNNYGGGHVIEALFMAPWLKLFGSHSLIVKAIPAAISCLFMAVLYVVIYRFFSRRLALVSLAIFSFSCSFVSYNFLVNGSMTTMLFSWIGLYFFFCFYYGDRPRLHHLFWTGLFLGFAVYCFDYAFFYVMAVVGLLLFRYRLGILKQWKALLLMASGVIIGWMPALAYNFIHHNFGSYWHYVGENGSGQLFLQAFLTKALNLVIHDLPGFFNTQIIDFAPRISWLSFMPWIVFCLALAYLVIVLRAQIIGFFVAIFRVNPSSSSPDERILCFLYFFVLYGIIYSLSSSGGQTPRYCILFYPALPVIFSWSFLRLGHSRFKLAILCLVLYMAPQLWYVAALARDKTTTEHLIKMNGEDVDKVVKFLEENNLTTVITPYEIKWKLMFASDRRIAFAADIFGFDREEEQNRIVWDRINRQHVPLTMIVDKGLQMPRIALESSNPQAAFDMQSFFVFLRDNGIQYQVTMIGDYVIFHNFSKHIMFRQMGG